MYGSRLVTYVRTRVVREKEQERWEGRERSVRRSRHKGRFTRVTDALVFSPGYVVTTKNIYDDGDSSCVCYRLLRAVTHGKTARPTSFVTTTVGYESVSLHMVGGRKMATTFASISFETIRKFVPRETNSPARYERVVGKLRRKLKKEKKASRLFPPTDCARSFALERSTRPTDKIIMTKLQAQQQ